VNTKTAKPNPEGRIRNNRVFVDWWRRPSEDRPEGNELESDH
jgi:hypothetical protein